jgi:hypothetical protein
VSRCFAGAAAAGVLDIDRRLWQNANVLQ